MIQKKSGTDNNLGYPGVGQVAQRRVKTTSKTTGGGGGDEGIGQGKGLQEGKGLGAVGGLKVDFGTRGSPINQSEFSGTSNLLVPDSYISFFYQFFK